MHARSSPKPDELWAFQESNCRMPADPEVCLHSLAEGYGSRGYSAGRQPTLVTYDWKPLPPLPLNFNNNALRTPISTEIQHVNHFNSRSPSLSNRTASSHEYSRSPMRTKQAEELDLNRDPKNKPLPLEPYYTCSTQQQPRLACTDEEGGIEEAQALPSEPPFVTQKTIPNYLAVNYTADKGQIPARLPDPVNIGMSRPRAKIEQDGNCHRLNVKPSTKLLPSRHAKRRSQLSAAYSNRERSLVRSNDRRVRKYVNSERRYQHQSKARKITRASRNLPVEYSRPCYQPSSIGSQQLTEDTLLKIFFGFDLMGPVHPLTGARLDQVRRLLSIQPHPDTMVNDAIHPILSCVWLRNYMVGSPHRLEIDRGRLRGLRLEDESSQNIHRGFGRLWDFLHACGLNSSHNSGMVRRNESMNKDNQILWFQVSKQYSRSIHYFLFFAS